METQTNINEIVKPLSQRVQRENRQNVISNIANYFISSARTNNLIAFPREHINVLLETLTLSESQKDRITNELIAYLVEAKLIKETPIKKVYYGFQRSELKSQDYGSYKILMQVNRNKPEDKQGCYSQTGNKSYFKHVAVERAIKVYELI